jgi:adenine phosphoribosyltransferase
MTINIKDYFSKVPNFPKEGILFYDISPLLMNPKAWSYTIEQLCEKVKKYNPDVLVALESRGFLLGSAVAKDMQLPLTMVRKKGKLPGKVIEYTYNLEYGTATIEIQENALKKGQKVLILDDVLATGGTINAAVELLNSLNVKTLGALCIMGLKDLKGKENSLVAVETLVDF